MEQRLDATYLHRGVVERATAIGIAAVGIGTGILLAAWGISFLWRYAPPEIAVRIANPELRVIQEAPFTVTQDKPFVIAQAEPLKIDPGKVTIKVEQTTPSSVSREANDTKTATGKTATGEVIRREVTVFSNVKHGPGKVVTGWNYKDGSDGVPLGQYCYYSVPDVDHSQRKIDIASNGVRLPHASSALVPDLEEALAKCQWWQG
jgi:hypothetical protein